ncbi:hypothetical protein AC579_8488 [Pseudocercospora musae]|uniref:Uncharacterized protein n=1 Tax=Pseudocercospora musae TaxID=113226 RepID=A0A139I3V7_9PEZI|nr:hypothetical protein AC579_8488 [Pseudocercospora musae]
MPFMPETTYNTRAGEVQAACRRQCKSAKDMTIDEICALPKDNLGYQYLLKLFKHLEVDDILYKTANDQGMLTYQALKGRFQNAIWHAPRNGFSHVRVELDVQEARMLKGLRPLPNTFMLNTKRDAELRGLNFPRHHPGLKSWLEEHGVYTDQKSISIIDQKRLNVPTLSSCSSTSSRRSKKSNSIHPEDEIPELSNEEYEERQKLAGAQAIARTSHSGPCSLRLFANKVANYVPPLNSLPADWAAKLSPQEVAQREQARKEAIEELEYAVAATHGAFETAPDEASRAAAQVKLEKARFELMLVKGDHDLMEIDG